MIRKCIPFFLMVWLTACASTGELLQRGQADFKDGNYTQAFEQLQPLAEKNNADAQYAIGYMYYYGQGTQKNIIRAQQWIRKAASQGQVQAIKAMTLLSNKTGSQGGTIGYPDALNLAQ